MRRPLGPANVGTVPRTTVEDLRAALSSFNKRSGGGPFGWCPLHLVDALGPARSDQLLEHLCEVVNRLVRAQANRVVASVTLWGSPVGAA